MVKHRCAKAVVRKPQCWNGKVTRAWEGRGCPGQPWHMESLQHGGWECGRNSPAIYLCLEMFSWRTEQNSVLQERTGQWMWLFWRLFFCKYPSPHLWMNICTWKAYWVSNPRAGRITSSLLPLVFFWTFSSLSVLAYPLLFLPISSMDNILMISFQGSHSERYGVVLCWDLGSQRLVPLFVAHGMEQCAGEVERRD